MQSLTHLAYFSESAAEPSPWSQPATHSLVALTWESEGLGT